MKTTELSLGEAIRAVRLALNETQESMARRIGAQLRSYARWESGRACPRGDWLLKIVKLCPNEGTRSLFGLEAAAKLARGSHADARRKFPGRDDAEALRYFESAATGLNILYEAAAEGHQGAREALRDLADKLSTRGGHWERMKYLSLKRK
jgi:transcriptional regulator with XRE-family HTH domain